MSYDYCIVGAGLAGVVLAERLANQKNKKVLLIEKREHCGGNLYDEYDVDGILIHRYGPHFFRTDEIAVWQYLSKFTEWHHYEHKVKSNVIGMEVPFPINLDTYNAIFNDNLTSIEFKRWLESNYFTDSPQNAEESIINQVGEYLYELFFKNYTLKQWGQHPKELKADTVRRVPVRVDRESRYQLSRYQGIPIHGYTHMIKKMISNKNIHLMLNVDYKEVIDKFDFDFLIYTGPLDYFYDYKYGRLDYRSLKFKRKHFSKESYQSEAVINYPNNYDFTRITEYKKLTGQTHLGTTIHEEYPVSFVEGKNEPYYPILNDRNLALKDKYLNEAKSEKNVIFIGRLAEYKYYAMDEVVEEALRVFLEKLS